MQEREKIYRCYPISKLMIKRLKQKATEPKNRIKVIIASLLTDEVAADWIIEAATHNMAFDKIQFKRDTIIPLGRTDYYAYRRRFYYIFLCLLANNIQGIERGV